MNENQNKLLELLGYIPTLIVGDGHGYNPKTGEVTPGKRTPNMPDTGEPIYENQFNKPVTDMLKVKAEAMGWDVVHVSPELEATPLKTRTDRANEVYQDLRKKYPNVPKEKLCIGVSVHFNAYDGKFGTNKGGSSTYHCTGSKYGEILAGSIQKYLSMGTPQLNRGVKHAKFWMLRKTYMVYALVEAGFMDVLEEAKLMLNKDYQDEVATEILQGCCEYMGIPYKYNSEIDNLKTKLNKYENIINTIKELIGGI